MQTIETLQIWCVTYSGTKKEPATGSTVCKVPIFIYLSELHMNLKFAIKSERGKHFPNFATFCRQRSTVNIKNILAIEKWNKY